MPFVSRMPIVKVEAGAMHSIDTHNVENLFGLWSGMCSIPDETDDGDSLTLLNSILEMRNDHGGREAIREPQLETVVERGLHMPRIRQHNEPGFFAMGHEKKSIV